LFSRGRRAFTHDPHTFDTLPVYYQQIAGGPRAKSMVAPHSHSHRSHSKPNQTSQTEPDPGPNPQSPKPASACPLPSVRWWTDWCLCLARSRLAWCSAQPKPNHKATKPPSIPPIAPSAAPASPPLAAGRRLPPRVAPPSKQELGFVPAPAAGV
jgi:hypothetical protein